MKKRFFTIWFLILALLTGCKNSYIDIKTIPRPDCSGETSIWKEFDKHLVKLLVIPDSPSDSVKFKRMFNFKKGQYHDTLIKRESELTPVDYTKGLDIYGNINDFKNWEKFDLPIKKLDYGYEFENLSYQNKFDGIYYISKDRQVFSGNSLKIIWEIQTTMTTYYKYIIFKKGLLSKYCLPDDRIIDIDIIRETNFTPSLSKYFNIFVDKKFSETKITDSVVIDICQRMRITFPDFKINAFLHDDANSTRLFTNFFFMTGCDTLGKDFLINTVAMNGIHTNGLDLEMIKHETFHLLWNTIVGSPGNQSFLSEGIQEYYQQLLDSSRIKKNFQILNRYSDYNIENLIIRGNGQDFWGGPSENNWPIAYNISGLFVKYLIDNWGLESFKEFYIITDRERAYKTIYDMSYNEIIQGFYTWMDNAP